MATGTLHQLGDTGLLTLGAVGADVTALQRQLNALRVTFIAIPESGVFDMDTSNAVKAFQSKASLPTTGSVDSETRAALAKAAGSLQPATSLAAQAPVMNAPPMRAPLPLWQTGLMVLGGIALVGGALWAVTREDEPKTTKSTLPSDAPDTTLAGTAHVKPLKTATKVQKCPIGKTPTDADAGEPILA